MSRDRRPLRAHGERLALPAGRALRRHSVQLRKSRSGLPRAEGVADAGDPGQPRLGRPERRREAPAREPDEPERPGIPVVGLRPHGDLCAAVRDQGHVLDRRHAALGERRRGRQRRSEECARPRALRDGRGPPLQRHVPRRRRACHPAGAPLARLERAEQPRLPAASVPQGCGQGRDSERDRLREDLQCDRQGNPEDDDRRLEGRLRRDRPARQQQPELEQARHVAAAVPARDEEGRRQGVRRLRAPPVLRSASRDAEYAARRPGSTAMRRRRSRSETSACSSTR